MKHTCYELKARNKSHQVEVGWDGIFETYFLVVFDRSRLNRNQLEFNFGFPGTALFYLGKRPNEISTVQELVTRAKAFAQIPTQVIGSLLEDRV